MPENNRNQNPNESYTNKYQKHVFSSYGYLSVCVDDKFSKPFQLYLGEDAAYSFIDSMVEENKCSSDTIKKNFNKELGHD